MKCSSSKSIASQRVNILICTASYTNQEQELHRPVPAGLISISHLCVFNIHAVRSLLMFSVFYVIPPHSLPVVIPLFSFFKFSFLQSPFIVSLSQDVLLNTFENLTSQSRERFNQYRKIVLDNYAVTSMSPETRGVVLCVHSQSLLRLSPIIKKQRIKNGSHVSGPNTIRVDVERTDKRTRCLKTMYK